MIQQVITALFAIPGFDKLVQKFVLSAAGQTTLKAFKAKYSDNNFSQSGQAGAVPPPDPAPLTGGPHEDASIENSTQPKLQYVNNWDARNFHMKPDGTLADEVNNDLKNGHSSNGTSFNNNER